VTTPLGRIIILVLLAASVEQPKITPRALVDTLSGTKVANMKEQHSLAIVIFNKVPNLALADKEMRYP